MNKKSCELCGNIARMYCESDEASLCWDCDAKVHCANFLVAKHSRNLLCHSCQSPTPWTASGQKISPTLSVCTTCLDNKEETEQSSMLSGEIVEENYETESDEEDDDDEYDSDNSEADDEDVENQVVPLSSSQSITSSLARSITCSSSNVSFRDHGGAMAAVSSRWKRSRETDCLHSEDEEACSSELNSKNLSEDNKGTSSMGLLGPMKVLRTNELCDLNKAAVGILRFQQNLGFSQNL